jgi:PTH1 family peptidyl-tRNA hydrolase
MKIFEKFFNKKAQLKTEMQKKSNIDNSQMLIIGLGNPTAKYKNNRHNIGFLLVDEIAKHFNVENNWQKKFKAEYNEFVFEGKKIRLLKPQTYMNLSGAAAIEAANFYKIPLEDILVIHDELDLPLCKLRIKQAGGNGGHNGLKSLDSSIGVNYFRMRFGISRPPEKSMVSSFVLSDFTTEEFGLVEKVFDEMIKNINLLLFKNYEKLMSKIADELSEKPVNKAAT